MPEEKRGEKGIVSYDSNTDKLTVDVKNRPAREVFTRIAYLSGVEILIDEKIDQPMTMKIKGLPLDRGIKNLIRGFSHVMIYETDKKTKKPVLITLKVLNKKKEERGQLKPAVSLDREISLRNNRPTVGATAENASTPQPAENGYVSRRWKKRLEMMSEEDRAAVDDRIASKEKRRKEQEERKKEREKRRTERKKRQKEREEQLKKENPELYELRMEQRERRREEIRRKRMEKESQQ